MTALFRQLDRLAALRLEQFSPTDSATYQLQAVSEALYGEPVPERWLPQVMDPPPSGAPASQDHAAPTATSGQPVHTVTRPDAAIAQDLARATDRDAFFPEVTLAVLTIHPQSLADQMERIQAPTPTGWWAHYRPANEAVRQHTLAHIQRWRLKEIVGTLKRQAALLSSTTLAMAGVFAHSFLHQSLVGVVCLLGTSACLGWGLSQRTRYLPEGPGRALALELADDWQPAMLEDADRERAEVFPELAQAVHRWATSDTGLLRQDLHELRWRHRHLQAAQQHAANVARLKPTSTT